MNKINELPPFALKDFLQFPTNDTNDLALAYREVRNQSCNICQPLQTEDYVVQPVPYASPPKWHLAHTTWFLEEMLLVPNFKGYTRFNDNFRYLFNSYYNSMGSRSLRADRGNMTRPTVHEVMNYRQHVDHHMIEWLNGDIDPASYDLVVLALHHEQQHQELLWSDIKYILGHNPIFPVYQNDKSLVHQYNDFSGALVVEGGVYTIGYQSQGFSFDNEHGPHEVLLRPFAISKSLVTNGEYLAFMEDGGYRDPKYWLDDGWSWINHQQINAPMYWHYINEQWHHYTLAGLKVLDLDSILSHVSQYEAMAYATWKGTRLPSEFEWEVASNDLNWGTRWEWTNSAYLPYPDFKISEGAVGEYNGKFMSNQIVLRGSSSATSEGHRRSSYRNFFQPHTRWQFSGIRLINE